MQQNQRRAIIICVILIVGVIVLSVISKIESGRRTLYISTDTVPLQLQLGTKTYTLTKKSQKLTVGHQSYNYRATALIHGKSIALNGTEDFTESKTQHLTINFAVYSVASVINALCQANGGASCDLQSTAVTVNYYEDYQWAVALINDPSLGGALAVLDVQNGKWHVDDGPATYIQTGGFYPQTVEEAIDAAEQ